jgi:hypothetical protein
MKRCSHYYLVAGALAALIAAGGAGPSIGSLDYSAGPVQHLPGEAGDPMKVRCKTYDRAEWYLLTGMDSEYGGTWCYRA